MASTFTGKRNSGFFAQNGLDLFNGKDDSATQLIDTIKNISGIVKNDRNKGLNIASQIFGADFVYQNERLFEDAAESLDSINNNKDYVGDPKRGTKGYLNTKTIDAGDNTLNAIERAKKIQEMYTAQNSVFSANTNREELIGYEKIIGAIDRNFLKKSNITEDLGALLRYLTS